jgi:serine/threonine protein kinase
LPSRNSRRVMKMSRCTPTIFEPLKTPCNTPVTPHQVRKTALREIRILKQLKHDNIVKLNEVTTVATHPHTLFLHSHPALLSVIPQTPPNSPLHVRCFGVRVSSTSCSSTYREHSWKIWKQTLTASKSKYLCMSVCVLLNV